LREPCRTRCLVQPANGLAGLRKDSRDMESDAMRISLLLSALPMLALFAATAGAAVPDSTGGPLTALQDSPRVIHTSPPPAYAPDRILVKFQPGAAASEVGQLMRKSGAKTLKVISGIDVHVLQVPEGRVEEEVNRFAHNPNVLYAEPDLYRVVSADPYFPNEIDLPYYGDTLATNYFEEQWALNNTGQTHTVVVDGAYPWPENGTPDADIDAPEAWAMTKGNPAVKIAILDSGIDCHPNANSPNSIEFGQFAFNGNTYSKCVEQKSFVTQYSTTLDDLVGHGTHVAGIAAAITDNSIGVAGVGFNSTVGNLKTCFEYDYDLYPPFGYYVTIGVCPVSSSAEAILYAANHGYHVINMSYGSDKLDRRGNPTRLAGYNNTEAAAVTTAWDAGVVLVAAAGNDGTTTKSYPAAYPEVLAVGATDHNDQRASFSSYGNDWVSLMAPGVDIFSTYPNIACFAIDPNFDFIHDACLNWLSGTSMASPHVAGAAALAWAYKYANRLSSPATCKDPSGVACNQMIRLMLEQGADHTGASGENMLLWSQHGRLNVAGALNASPEPPPLEPAAPTILTPVLNTDKSVTVNWGYNGAEPTGFAVLRQQKSGKSWGAPEPACGGGTVSSSERSCTDIPGTGTFRYQVAANFADPATLFSNWSAQIKVR